MEVHTIELSTDELLLIARVTGMMLGYAVPDRYCDRRLVQAVFDRAHEKLSESVGPSNAMSNSDPAAGKKGHPHT